jgi:hypothetical protein
MTLLQKDQARERKLPSKKRKKPEPWDPWRDILSPWLPPSQSKKKKKGGNR